MRWNLIKFKIRQVTIKNSKERAREKRRKLPDIEISIKTLEENCDRCPSSENADRLEILKMVYDKFYEELTRGAIFRSKQEYPAGPLGKKAALQGVIELARTFNIFLRNSVNSTVVLLAGNID